MTGTQGTHIESVAASLEVVASEMGLTLPDMVELFAAGVKVADFLDYAEAVRTNRLD
jgi:hypothetical protein